MTEDQKSTPIAQATPKKSSLSDQKSELEESEEENNQQTQKLQKQVEFFAFETQIRSHIFTLVDPISTKLKEMKKQFDGMSKDFRVSQKVLNQVEQIVLNKDSQEPNIFDRIQNKIADVASESSFRDGELTNQLDILKIKSIR